MHFVHTTPVTWQGPEQDDWMFQLSSSPRESIHSQHETMRQLTASQGESLHPRSAQRTGTQPGNRTGHPLWQHARYQPNPNQQQLPDSARLGRQRHADDDRIQQPVPPLRRCRAQEPVHGSRESKQRRFQPPTQITALRLATERPASTGSLRFVRTGPTPQRRPLTQREHLLNR